MTLPAGTRLGPYEILSPLGAGGMGEVYRAQDTRLDRQVAVKVLSPQLAGSPEALARFEREAKAVAALSHSNIVALYDFGQSKGMLYAVTELLEGETLRSRLAVGELPVRKAIEVAVQIAQGLAAAHDKGIVHRDLKPENVFLTKAGPAKVLDFGLARQSAFPSSVEDTRSPTVARATDPGTVLGTVGYMSPEQVRGKVADHRSDVFSFGSVLYEMLSGRRAFQGESPAETMASIAREDPPNLSELQKGLMPGLERVVHHCLEKDPEDRFQSARDLAFDLLSLSSVSTPQKAQEIPEASGRRRWLAVGAAALCLAIGVVGGGLWATRRGKELPSSGNVRFRPLTDAPGEERSPRLSPDGQTLIYVSGAAGNADIYSVRVGGRNATNLTADSKDDDWGPAFSSDGRQIAFRSERDGGGIFIMGATGESVRRLTDFGYDPAWSPDGKQIAVATEGIRSLSDRLDVSELWVVSVADGSKKLLTKGDAVQPAWSPDGARIAFWSFPSVSGQARRAVRSMPAGGRAERGIETVAEDAREPTWSADGRYLYYSSERGGPMNIWRVPVDSKTGKAVGKPEPLSLPALIATSPTLSRQGALAYVSSSVTTSIRRLPFDARRGEVTGPPEELWSSTQELGNARFSPDGTSIVLARASGMGLPEDILLTRLDGSGLRLLTDDPFTDRDPHFSPDGRHVTFFSGRSGGAQIWEISVDGSGLKEFHLEGHRGFYPLYSPDGTRLEAVDEKGSSYVIDRTRPDAKWTPLHVAVPGEPLADAISSWSKDGRYLAGDLADQGYRHIGIFVQSVQTGERRRLTDAGERPLWLSDSRRLLYDRDGAIVLLDTESGHSSEVVPSLKPPRIRDSFDLSGDEKFLLLTEVTRQSDIWLMTRE